MIDLLPFKFDDAITETLICSSKKDVAKIDIKIVGRKNGLYSETERKLSKAYQEILGYNELEIQSNFFEIGGDSITAVKICATAEKYGIEITPVEFMRYQTIESIAKHIDERKNNG